MNESVASLLIILTALFGVGATYWKLRRVHRRSQASGQHAATPIGRQGMAAQ